MEPAQIPVSKTPVDQISPPSIGTDLKPIVRDPDSTYNPELTYKLKSLPSNIWKIFHSNSKAIPTPYTPPKFSYDDPKANDYFNEHGYCVFENIANPKDVQEIHKLLWKHLEGMGMGIKRNSSRTWKSWPAGPKGLFNHSKAGQSEASWYCRGLPQVQKLYQNLYNTKSQLKTSFDGLNIQRPWQLNKKWEAKPILWHHLDNNPRIHETFLNYQGYLQLTPSGPNKAGLVVIPGSHKYFKQLKDFIPHSAYHYVAKLPTEAFPNAPLKICCDVGDFVCWSSATVHSNWPDIVSDELRKCYKHQSGQLGRFVCYISMVPEEFVPESLKEDRKLCVQKGKGSSHWVTRLQTTHAMENIPKKWKLNLSDYQKKLI